MILANPAKVLKDVIKTMVQDTIAAAANRTDAVETEEQEMACMDASATDVEGEVDVVDVDAQVNSCFQVAGKKVPPDKKTAERRPKKRS